VDVVLELGSAAVAGIEVKAAATVVERDFRGLRKLSDTYTGRHVFSASFVTGSQPGGAEFEAAEPHAARDS